MMSEIPTKKSTHKGIPLGDGTIAGAQEALVGLMGTPKEQIQEPEQVTETEDIVSEQAMENAESVETEVEDSNELTAEDISEDTQQEEVKEQTFTVKINGKEVEVTQDELLDGYSRTSDYIQKTQVLSEQRKQIDSELNATQQERQRYTQALKQLEESNDFEIAQLNSQDLEKLKEEDPLVYMQKKDALRDLQENKVRIANERAKAQEAEQKEMHNKLLKQREEQLEILNSKLPEWNHPEKGAKLKSDIKNYALNQGFTEQEVNMLIDARSIQVLNNAMKYENLLNAKIANKKTKVVPKVQKPGTGTSKGEVKSERVKQLKSKASKSGKVNDAAKYIESMLG
jgi:hypothetical protein